MGNGGVQPARVQVSGEIRGQVAIGDNIIQYNVDHGGVVVNADLTALPQARRRSQVRIVGRRPQLVGRDTELRLIAESLTPATPVELSGPAGIGKTALLKDIAHTLPAARAAVVFHNTRGEPAEDVLQLLYDSFYETTIPLKPTSGQLTAALAGVEGLIVLDDVALRRDEVDSILDAVPEACVVLGSEKRLWGQGRALAVAGLPPEAAVALLERELGRELEHDRAAGEQACEAVDNSPLRVIQLGALVRDLGDSVADLPALLDGPSAPAVVHERLTSSLGAEQLRVLGILHAALGASISAHHLGALTGVPSIKSVVEPLLRSGLVQAHSPRYSVREESPRSRRQGRQTEHEVADYLAELGESEREPEALAQETAVVLATLDQAVEARDWPTVRRLGRAVERTLFMSRRWGAWEIVLRHQLEGAAAVGDRSGQAWALHQLGTRALGLGDHAAARSHLTRALALRRALGDDDGSAATRHNLERLDGPPPAPLDGSDHPPDSPSPASVSRPLAGVLALALAALVVVAGVVAVGRHRDDDRRANSMLIKTSTYSVQVEPAEIDFGEETVGSAGSRRHAAVVNTGFSPVRFGQSVITDAGVGFTVESDTCATREIRPRDRCELEVVFRPPVPGRRTADVTVPLPDRAAAVSLRGRGVQPEDTPATTSSPDDGNPTTRPPRQPSTTVGPPETTSTVPEPTADLQVTLSRCGQGPNPAFCYVTATLTNLGPSTANNVLLTVRAIPDGVIELEPPPFATYTADCNHNTCTLGVPSLASAEKLTVTYRTGEPKVEASLEAAEPDPDLGNNSATSQQP